MDSLMVDELFVASVDNAKEKDKLGFKGHSIQSTDVDTQRDKMKSYKINT